MAPQEIRLATSDRFAIVGKTRAGKTVATVILASILLPWEWPPPKVKTPWQIWWIDTKHDPKDRARLRRWGYADPSKVPEKWPRLVFTIRPLEGDELSVARQVQAIAFRAMERTHVILVIDEYVSCVMSRVSMGAGLKDVAQRGGGKRIGLIGETQEPTGVPRQLLSQATHEFLFNQTFRRDVEWCQEECPIYGDGPPDKRGFYYRWLDGDKDQSVWMYFRDITEFRAKVAPRDIAVLDSRKVG